ncbi:hypothetical protein SAMN05880590_101456 [Rhizobium sp. RU35A]|uniref:hypothetical protein n=1 Tax=Rhizobium sp. RU35A TaxID=1907414 RepID=UPI000953C096|nr:hypothetical protein [Rhizobium sp. RU35A]SIP96146.1 hypothetical protein SAMN05880590_101456 [Rhizobium sp. RU35A]
MAIPTLFRNILTLATWATRIDGANGEDILQHPQIHRMSLRDLADLPLGQVAIEVAIQETPTAAQNTLPLSRCA